MHPDHEKYIYFQECLTSLNRAWSIIGKILDSSERNELTRAAYELAIIEYCKPYKNSLGWGKKGEKLEAPSLSATESALHNRLIRLRDKELAQSDLPEKDRKLYLGSSADRRIPLIIKNTGPDLPDPKSVKDLIERILDTLYDQLSEIEQKAYSAL